MSKIILLNEQERTNAITNTLWFKFAADLLSRDADNNLSCIYEISEDLLHSAITISEMLDMCNDLRCNDRSNIPNYLKKFCIENSNDLKDWLECLEEDEIFSDEEAELLYNDYRSLAGEMGDSPLQMRLSSGM